MTLAETLASPKVKSWEALARLVPPLAASSHADAMDDDHHHQVLVPAVARRV